MDQSTEKFSRRDFLKIVAVSGAAGAALKLSLPRLNKLHRISRSQILMGTIVTLTLISSDKGSAIRAVDNCLSEMSNLETILSRYRQDSELSQLNNHGVIPAAHPALIDVVQSALEISRLSNGAFDISVKPLLDLYQRGESHYADNPDIQGLENVLSLVNYQDIHLDGPRIWFTYPQMEITLDGIAKGYIVDRGIETLKENGFCDVMVEAGGDLYAGNFR